MAGEVVENVPDPWLSYKDGRLWRFHSGEAYLLPGWRPFQNIMGEIDGLRRIQWTDGDYVYFRFTDLEVFTPEELSVRGHEPALKSNPHWSPDEKSKS